MSNLYFKNNAMGCLFKKVYSLKMLLLIFMLAFWFMAYSRAQTELYFSPWNLYPILNTNINDYSSDLIINAVNVDQYGVDVYDEWIFSWQKHPNDKLLVNRNAGLLFGTIMPTSIGGRNSRSVFPSPDVYSVFEFAAVDLGGLNFIDEGVWQLNFMNTWTVSWAEYLTSSYIDIYDVVGSNHATKIIIDWTEQNYDSISWLNIYFWAAPAVADTQDPTFPNNAWTSTENPHFPNSQGNRQDKNDFNWTFDLLDSSNPTSNNNGWMAEPDFYAGTNFRPNADNWVDSSITNQDGINSWSFALQVFIATGWDNNTAQNAWSTWEETYTYNNIHVAITLTWEDKTWAWLDKNYSGSIDKTTISDFGVEELVMISGYVEDRNMYPSANWVGWAADSWTWENIKQYSPHNSSNDRNFVYYFNQGMRPWFNNDTEESYIHTPTCELDLVQSQTGFVIRTITGFLHDDWAGIDISTVQVIVTGTISDNTETKIYTGGVNLSLTPFDLTSSGCRVDDINTNNCSSAEAWTCGNTDTEFPGDWSPAVCNSWNPVSTGNYELIFSDDSRSYDPEDPIYVTIKYKDNKWKDWRPVSCTWGVEKTPRFVWTGDIVSNWEFQTYFDLLMQLSNHPNWAQINPIDIQLQDDWAGVDTGEIAWLISGSELNWTLDGIESVNIDLQYDTDIYSPISWANLWSNNSYPNYNNWLWINIWSIPVRQLLNYELSFDQTDSNDSDFTDYFAPEHDIDLTLTFEDKDADDWTKNTVSNPINVKYINDEGVEFWEHTKTSNFVDGSDNFDSTNNTAVWIYLTGKMADLFSWTVASWENRIFPYDLTWDNQSELSELRQTDIAFKVTDNWAWVNSGTVKVTVGGERRWSGYTYVFTASNLDFAYFDRWDNGGWNLLNYLTTLTDHNIYFDRQSLGSNGEPVEWRASRYTITLEWDDLKQPTANSETVSFTRDMENLSCEKLDRCNASLYFTYDYGSGIVPVVQTWVHPFLWQTLYVIASGDQVIYTGVNDNYIACNGAGTLWAPLDIDFAAWMLDNGEDSSYPEYEHSELLIMDGNFELNGGVLTLK